VPPICRSASIRREEPMSRGPQCIRLQLLVAPTLAGSIVRTLFLHIIVGPDNPKHDSLRAGSACPRSRTARGRP